MVITNWRETTRYIIFDFNIKILANPLPQKSGQKRLPRNKRGEHPRFFLFFCLSVCPSSASVQGRDETGMFANFGALLGSSLLFPQIYDRKRKELSGWMEKRGGKEGSLLFLFLRVSVFFFSGFWDVWRGRKKWCLRRCLVFSPAFLFHRSEKEIAFCRENKVSVRLRKESSHYTAVISPCIQILCLC